MTTRDRWTVYPLLFLALGLAIRAAVLTDERQAVPFESLEADRIECRELVVRDAAGNVLLQVPPAASE